MNSPHNFWSSLVTDKRFIILAITTILMIGVISIVIQQGDDIGEIPSFDALATPVSSSLVDNPGSNFPPFDPAQPQQQNYQILPTPYLREVTGAETILRLGETIAAPLEAGGLRLWNFAGTENDKIDVILAPHGDFPSEFDLVIEIYTPSGELLTKLNENVGGQPEIVRGLELPASGDYTAWVSEANFNVAGSYTLTILNEQIKLTYPRRIGAGQTVEASLEKGDWQVWVFSAAAGEVLTIQVEPFETFDANFDPFLSVWTPDGSLLMESNRGGVREVESIDFLEITVTGNYTLWLADTEFENAGSYLLKITQ